MNWLRDLIRLFSKLFQRRLPLPHPEEKQQVGVKAEDVDLSLLMERWLLNWEVFNPAPWRQVSIKLVENLYVLVGNQLIKVPEATWAKEQRMELDPEWANPGVLAHGMAHISYSLLSKAHQSEFETAYKQALATDELLKYVVSKKPYMRTGGILEAHADTYRFLGTQMPEQLKGFYPELLFGSVQ